VLVRSRPAAGFRSCLVVLTAVLAVLAGGLVQAPAATAYPGAPWFEPSKVYTQNFPDPHVMRVGDTFYAYATGTGGSYLPVMHSTDLRTWVARDAYDPGGGLAEKWPGFNDALPWVAKWGVHEDTGMHMTSWVMAPGVARFGTTYNAYYSLWAEKSPVKHCISVATSSSPEGPFTDRTERPLSCDADTPGDIDPFPFIDPATGTPYLLWASEGPGGNPPTKLWSRQLTPDGLAFAPGSAMRELTRTTLPWEGKMIENPAMIHYAGTYFLLYSANDWWTDRYAIGFAVCDTPLGPCRKTQGHPLLGNHGDKLGPGGPAAFVDTAGRLRMAYHHWTAPYVGYPTDPNCDGNGQCTSQGQRRMSVTELRLGPAGLEVGSARPTPTVLTTDGACPNHVPEDGFVDVPLSSVHESAIDCVAWWQVAAGHGDRYVPQDVVTRAQMASFLANAVLRSGGNLPSGSRDAFRDDDGSVHEESINRLAAAGIVLGGGDGDYGPTLPVTRAQMATFLVRALEHRTGTDVAPGDDWFYDDDASVHEPAINAAATAGLAGGTGGGGYTPNAGVRRDQMASFLSRLLEAYVRAGAQVPAG
jgi:hypothetical protein